MKQIIIADPRKENIINIMIMLEKDYVIFPARSAAWMLKVLKQKDIDLVIMNIDMGGGNRAPGLMKKIRSSYRYKDLPFIVASTDTSADIGNARECISMGKCEAMVIPLDKKEIVSAVEDMLHSNT